MGSITDCGFSIKKISMKKITSFFFLLFSFVFQIFPISRSDAALLVIKCEDETVFTQSEIQFVLEIPHTELSDFSFDIPELPLGVHYISSTKSASTDLSGDTTAIVRLWFSFSDAGEIKLPPIVAKIGKRTVEIPFEKVDVYENPSLVSPKFSVSMSPNRKIRLGEKVTLEIFIQYCTQIVNFSANLHKDAILTERFRDDFCKDKNRKTEFSPEKIKIAVFDFQPLVTGEVRLPDISVDAIAYNGSRVRISLSDLPDVVTVLDADSSIENKKSGRGAHLFDGAFDSTPDADENAEFAEWTESDLETLQQMRILERRRVFLFSDFEERKKFEEKHGLKDTEDEPSTKLFILISSLALVSIVLHIITGVLKKIKFSVTFAILFVVALVFSVRQNLIVSQQFAVSLGGEIFSVPETSAISNGTKSIPKGLRVKIVEDMGEWVYIECSETSGWTKKNTLLLIY